MDHAGEQDRQAGPAVAGGRRRAGRPIRPPPLRAARSRRWAASSGCRSSPCRGRGSRARGGKPMPNSWTGTPARRAMMKWPNSWMTTSTTRMTSSEHDVDEAVDRGPCRHPRPCDGRAAAAQARTSASRSISSSSVGLASAVAEALDRLRRERRRCPGSRASPSRNRSTATSSAAMSAAVARGPCRPAVARDARAPGSAPSSGASNVRLGVLDAGRGAAPGRRGGAGRSARTGWGCACQGVRAVP